MQIRTGILFISLLITLFLGWKYAYIPFSEREAAREEVEGILKERVKELSFVSFLPQKLPPGFYLHAPDILEEGGRESLHIQYTKHDGSVLDIYERAVREDEDVALPFRSASQWQEQKEISLKGNIPAYFVRGKDEKIEVLVEGKSQKLTLKMAMIAFSQKGTRIVVSNSAFIEGALLSGEELKDIANSMIET